MYRTEYPRPDFCRQEWQCLNGDWDFWADGSLVGKIAVPFVWQAPKSGISLTKEPERIAYERSFQVDANWRGKQIRLHFGAVDYRCQVWVNGQRVGEHQGGHLGFFVDITGVLTWGQEELRVVVEDPTCDETIPRGKQCWTDAPHGIWYTRSSGIWQSVWLEPVSQQAIEKLFFTPDIDAGQVEISVELSSKPKGREILEIEIYLKEQLFQRVVTDVVTDKTKLTVDIFRNQIFSGMTHQDGLCWCPNRPTLFQVKARLLSAAESGSEILDEVGSYFGMRKIHIEGGLIYLNNRPFYQKLVLDQGYWPEGLLTAPRDEDFVKDIEAAKAMGFNGCRKHQKTEDPRFLYWADTLGYLVWAEVASAPSYDQSSAIRMAEEWTALIRRDYNHPSIVAYVTINESWGVPEIARDSKQQNYALGLYHMAKALDSTRLVIGNDGWEMMKTDICAVHNYNHGRENDLAQQEHFTREIQNPEYFWRQLPGNRTLYVGGYSHGKEPVMLTEFGGISYGIDQRKDAWGYTSSDTPEAFLSTYRRLIETVKKSEILCGFCYTQLTDVEQETNGLMTYDRQWKVSPEEICAINSLPEHFYPHEKMQ